MVGGQESFGLGGFYHTPVEEALPVKMKSEKKKDTPSLAMMLVIDKSGSMDGEKIQFAKEAAIAAVELLSEKDYVGVLAFDGEPYVIADLQSAASKAGIVSSIERIDAGGGTAMYEPMVKAQEALSGVSAPEVLPAKLASPEYTAATERAGDGGGATALPPDRAAEATSAPVVVSRNRTVPVGTPAPGKTAATAAWRADAESCRMIVVLARLTVSERGDDTDAVLLESPAQLAVMLCIPTERFDRVTVARPLGA